MNGKDRRWEQQNEDWLHSHFGGGSGYDLCSLQKVVVAFGQQQLRNGSDEAQEDAYRPRKQKRR